MLLACTSTDRGQSPPADPGVVATAPAQPTAAPDLITGAGWECLPRTRVADGKVVMAGGPTGLSTLNDYTLRLQTGEDVAISITAEVDTAPGLAGIQFRNSLPPPGDTTKYYATAAKLFLGFSGGRVYAAVYEGISTKPAFQYTGREGGQQGPLALSVQRVGESLVVRVADAEVARTKVLGPLTGGALFFGPNVEKGRTLIVHRLAVTDREHPMGAEVVRAVAPAAPAGAAATLRTEAAARGRFIGAGISPQALRWDQQFRDVAAREFNMLSPTYGFNWTALRPAPDQYQFCIGDQSVAFAEANNMRVHAGHLSWGGSGGQNPAWVTEGKFSRDELIAILREHIQTVVWHYRGRVHVWNVVNEVFEFSDRGRLRDDENQIWMRGIGPEYIDMAFRWGHEADPQAVLLFNDVDAEGLNSKSDALYAFVKGMRARGVPIHGVGMQAHWGIRLGIPPRNPAMVASVAANMKRLADLGLDVYVTEMEVPVRKPATPEKLVAQAQDYRQMLEMCLAASNCKALIVWGVHDGDSNAQDPRFTTYDAPTLLDTAFRPKPAYNALAGGLRGR